MEIYNNHELRVWVCKMVASLEHIEIMLVNSNAKKGIITKARNMKKYFMKLVNQKVLVEIPKLKKVKVKKIRNAR